MRRTLWLAALLLFTAPAFAQEWAPPGDDELSYASPYSDEAPPPPDEGPTYDDFRNDARKTSDPRKANTNLMSSFAKSMTDDEIKDAAKYFTAIRSTPWIKVVESATVPKTKPQGGMFLVLEGIEAGSEPIGDRVIETPEKTHDTEFLRNPRSGFIAYVPPGSLKKGEALVMNGTTASGGKVTACTACHGSDLRGMGPVPTLAGRLEGPAGRPQCRRGISPTGNRLSSSWDMRRW